MIINRILIVSIVINKIGSIIIIIIISVDKTIFLLQGQIPNLKPGSRGRHARREGAPARKAHENRLPPPIYWQPLRDLSKILTENN